MRCDSYQLIDVCNFIDYRGKTPPKTNFGIPLITAKIIKNGFIQTPQEFIAYDFYEEWMRRGIPQKGDIVFTTEAPLGEVAVLNTDRKVAFAQRVIIFQSKPDILDSRYLYYALTDRTLKGRIEAKATGTTVVGIKSAELKTVQVDLPPLPEQKAIAAVLSALDEKIELNNRINQKLEEMAQAIFKSWFVDFEPFQDREFVESEMGLIPKGWRVERLSELCHSVSKKHDFKNKELIFLNTGDIEDGKFLHSNYMSVDKMPGQAKKSIQYGDILYSEIRPINRHFAFVNFKAGEYVVSTKLMVIRANGVNKRRLYNYLTSDRVIAELQMEAESRSGTFPQIRFENIQNLKILIASHEVEAKYSELLERVYGLQDLHTAENQRLATIRDALLPKLMSGEIRLPF